VKKPTLTDALAKPGGKTALTEPRITTTMRIEPSLLRRLKVAAAQNDRKLNDLFLEGVRLAVEQYEKRQAA
jgi:hypothetical protein